MGSVVVIGGGPAGMMAAGTAAAEGASVTLIERNEKLGKKLYITGKGRCNVTNASDKDGLMSATMSNARFMQSAFSAFGSADTMAFFEKNGVKLKTERGRRVFPESDKASDITGALVKFMELNKVRIICNRRIKSLDELQYAADAVIIATGGLAYPVTGSTGDGYRIASAFGHSIIPTYPSLVPLITKEKWVSDVSGLSLKNVRCSVMFPGEKKPVYTEIGEMMFMSEGVTGPLILSASRFVTGKISKNPVISIDLKPALDLSALDERIQRDFSESSNKNFANALDKLLPQRLIRVIISHSGIEPERKINSVTKQERQRLASLLKDLRLTPTSTAGYNEAVITVGGVAVNEINPSTMMSKKSGGLFFAGEVIDVDALTGGYNLQIAFSTGYLAGKSAAKYKKERLDD